MQKILVILSILTAVTGIVSANAWVCPEGDPNNLWSEASNWSDKVVPTNEKTTFTDLAAECIVDIAATCGQLVIGDNGGNDFTRELRVINGGSLVCGGTAWAASGYNRSSKVTVEEGGSIESVTRFGVGLVGGPKVDGVEIPQTSYLIIDGGEMSVNGNLEIGSVAGSNSSDHTGIVKVNSGLLEVNGLDFRDPPAGISFMDISYGTVIVNGDVTATVADYKDNEPANITGFGGDGTVEAVFKDGVTIITATHPMNPRPIISKDNILAEGEVTLSWTNLDPNTPGDSVWVDVWFGTDPNKLNDETYWQVISAPVAGENTISVKVPAPVLDEETGKTTYYWQVDSYIYGDPTKDVIESDVWSFIVSNDQPPYDVSAGPDKITWIGRSTDLIGTYEDDGKSPVNITWTANNPNVVFDPSDDGGVTGNAAAVTVTIDNVATDPSTEVVLTFAVGDALNAAVPDDMIVAVYADECQAARIGDNRAQLYPGDLTGPDGIPDCVINLLDFAEIALDWLNNYELKLPEEL